MVKDAQKAKDAAAIEAARAVLPANVAAVPASHGPVAPLTPEETGAAIETVDPATVGISGGLPRPAWWDFTLPTMNLQTLWIILPFSLILAGVGLIESLMTLTLVDGLTETRGRSNRECVGQGLANVACAGGCWTARMIWWRRTSARTRTTT